MSFGLDKCCLMLISVTNVGLSSTKEAKTAKEVGGSAEEQHAAGPS